MNKSVRLAILIGLVILLVGGVVFYEQKFSHWPWQPGVIDNSQPVTSSPNDLVGSQASEQEPQRERIMEDLAQKIAQLSDEEPVLGGHWFVERFWFVRDLDEDFYVEYEDGHILRRILVEASQENGNFSYQIIARFEPGESDWILKTGEDKQFGKGLDLYEFDEVKNKWVKKN